MKNKKIILALSGGVDSSIAAYLLKKQGYDITAVFMKNYSDTKNSFGECSYKDDKRSAQRVAAKLNIPLILIDSESQYKSKVLSPMFNSYSKNLTPNPDILCNKIIKFPLLWKKAKSLKIPLIATGHYAIVKKIKSSFSLYQPLDKSKDQTYFLSEMNQKDLSHTIFPLGKIKKIEVRALAKKLNFHNWNRPGTTGICFVQQNNMQNFLKSKLKEKPGIVKDPEGNILGTHLGSHFYTIGQKCIPSSGIQIKKPNNLAQKRFFIAEKKGNTLIAASEDHPLLKKSEVKIVSLHFINSKEDSPSNIKARIRHLGKLLPGKLMKKSNSYYFKFAKPQEAIAPGQYIVLYHKDKVIASGEMRY